MDDVSGLLPGEMLAIQSWLSFYSDNYDPVGEWFWKGKWGRRARVGLWRWQVQDAALCRPGFVYNMLDVMKVLHLRRWRLKAVSDQLEQLLNQT